MADAPQAAPPTTGLASQEARRLALARAQREQPSQAGGQGVQIDAGVLNVPFLGNRALRLANAGTVDLQPAQVPVQHVEDVAREKGRLAGIRQAMDLGLGRKQAYPQGQETDASQGSAAVDQAIARESREQQMASQLHKDRTADQGELGARDRLRLMAQGQTPFGPTKKEDVGLAESIRRMAGRAPSKRERDVGVTETLRRLAGKTPSKKEGSQREGRRFLDPTLGFGTGGTKERKKPEEQFSQLMMSGFIRACWGCLWLTYGHSIYVIDILFLAQAGSKYLRRYIPGVGEEWIPPQLLKVIPKTTLLPLKLGEIVGMSFVTFWVFIMDIILICLLAILYAAVDTVAKHL